MVFAEIIAITSAVAGLRITFAAARYFREGTLADLLLIILCLTIRLPHRQRLVSARLAGEVSRRRRLQ
jgi:hypothetical protein